MKATPLLSIAIAASALTLPVAYAADQTSINMAVEFQSAPAEAHVSGAQDMSILLDGLPGESVVREAQQTLCVFSSTRFFSMEVRGAAKGPGSGFWLEKLDEADPDLKYLSYDVRMHDVFNGGEVPLGGNPGGAFENGVAQNSIDSDPFNSDETCTDGENIRLTFGLPLPLTVLGGGHSNRAVLSNFMDGFPAHFTDQLTIVVAPDL